MKLRDLLAGTFRAIVTAICVAIADWFVFGGTDSDLSIALLPVFVAVLFADTTSRVFGKTWVWRAILVSVAGSILTVILQFAAIRASLPESTDAFVAQLPSMAFRIVLVLSIVSFGWEFMTRPKAPQD